MLAALALALPRTLVTVLLLASSSLASPVPLPQSELEAIAAEKGTVWGEDGFAPTILVSWSNPITFPTAGIEWRAGGEGYLEWSPVLPEGITLDMVAKTARLILGYTSPSSPGLNLDLDRPLGLDIALYEGPTRYNFTLPADLPSRSTYILSFQGSSGNISPEFTILGSGPLPTPESAVPTTTTAWVDTIPWETPSRSGSGTTVIVTETDVTVQTTVPETDVSVQTTLPVSAESSAASTAVASVATGVAAPAETLSTSGARRMGGWTAVVGAFVLVGAMLV